MSTRDDRPGGTGGYLDDRNPGNRASADPGANSPTTATQGFGIGTYNYYEDSGYSDVETTSLQNRQSEQYYEQLARKRNPFAWTAGADLGLLIIRLMVGGLFLAHGAQKLFSAFGGPGSEGFARALSKMGFQNSDVLSLVTGGTELGAGALLVLGLFTPLAAAGILGVMANAVFLRLSAGFFEVEFEVTLGAVALGLMFTGPGRVALDNGRAWFRRPVLSGFICLLIAAGASAAVLLLFHR